MYPSSNAATISSSAAVLNKIKRLIAQGIIKGFPVLISEKRVMDDYIINIDISDITPFTDGKRKKLKTLPDGKSKLSDEDLSVQVESIVYHYINYVEDLLFCDSKTPPEKLEAKRHFYRVPFDNYSEIFSDERYNLPLAKMYRDLLTALNGFSYYIKRKYPNFRDIMDEILKQAICVAKEDALDCEIKEMQKVSGKSPIKRINKKDIAEEFFNIVLKILEDENAYQAQDDKFLLLDYKMFQRYYRGANHKTFLSNCKKIGIIETPIRKKTGEPRGYAFDKMKDGKLYSFDARGYLDNDKEIAFKSATFLANPVEYSKSKESSEVYYNDWNDFISGNGEKEGKLYITEDNYGTWMSVFQPIRDTEGNIVGMIQGSINKEESRDSFYFKTLSLVILIFISVSAIIFVCYFIIINNILSFIVV